MRSRRSPPLFGPGSRAEVPIVGALGEGAPVVSGQVDRLVVDGADVWIVDYKSDRPPPSTVEETPPIYLRQMAAYRAPACPSFSRKNN